LYFADFAGVYTLVDGSTSATRIACGILTDIALAKDGTFALAIGAQGVGQVLLGDLGTRTVRATLPGGTRLAFSRDGSVLSMLDQDQRFTVYDTHSGALVITDPTTKPPPSAAVYDYDLSADGTYYLATRCEYRSCRTQRVAITGVRVALPSYSVPDIVEAFPRIAPAGLRSARASGDELRQDMVTTIFEGTTVTGSAHGLVSLWLDDARLLVNRYAASGGGYLGSFVVDAQGTELGKSPAALDGVRVSPLRDGANVFSRDTGELYETTGSSSTPVLSVGAGSIYGDANDERVLYVPRAGEDVGAMQVRSW
jgi:hypothetical protein